MDKKRNAINIDEYIFASYFVPFISCDSLVMIIFGKSIWGPYKVIVEGLQARIVGLLIFLFVANIFYFILIKWPKSLGVKKLKNIILKKFFLSPFFFLWVFAAIVLFLSKIDNINYFKYLYVIIIILVAYFQYKFINEIHSIIISFKRDNDEQEIL